MNRPGPFPLNASEWEVEKRGWLHKSSEEDTTRESCRVHYRDVREVMRSGGDLQWKDMTTIPGITPSTSCSTTGWCMCAQFHRHSLYQDSHQIIPCTIHLLLSTEKTKIHTTCEHREWLYTCIPDVLVSE